MWKARIQKVEGAEACQAESDQEETDQDSAAASQEAQQPGVSELMRSLNLSS